MSRFTHLHVHSQYSLLDGQASISKLVDKAMADGMPGMALTDHGNMFGIKEFYNYVNKKNSGKPDGEKFKPILGCEMYVAKKKKTEKHGSDDKGYHLIVLAKNLTGYHNLVKLVSRAWTEGFYYHPRTDRDDLEKYHEGLIVCSACLGGEIPRLIRAGDNEGAEEAVKWFKGVFGDDYYLELQRHQTFKENANRSTYPQQMEVNKVLMELSRKYGIKMIASNDVHFTNEDDAEAHDRLICISTNKKFDEERMHYTKQEWLKSTREMELIFADVPEAITNTQEIVDKVEFYSIDHAPIMPNFEIPADFGTEEEYRSRIPEQQLFDEFTRDEHGNVVLSQEEAEKKIERLGGYDKLYRIKFEADYLEKLTMDGAKKRYGDPLPEDVAERLKFELYIMKTMGFPGYFLIVQDFINVGRDRLGVSIGPGRGSAAGSAAAYCLGITQVDPIKYDLLFERFLNPDRISLPDIDVDFDDDGRYTVLDYVTHKYGAEKVAHIITYQSMATKSSIKDMARVMNLSVSDGNKLAKLVVDRLPDVDGKSPKINFPNLTKYSPPFKEAVNSPDPIVRDVMKYAGQLEGNVRGTGVHACGVIIGRDDITDWVPVSTAQDGDETLLVTQYEGSVIEETGLIKMDFLGLKTLSIIKEALVNIKARHGIDLDIDNIPLDDPLTFKLYCEGRTTSTFQFESPGMQKSLRELQPSKFEDLIAMNALYRPGPMDYIPSFIARKHGREPIQYDIPIMKQYLEETYGITVYQEQVMLLSRLLANFTRGESDMLRKAMGKKQIDKMAKLKVKFLDQGAANGHKPEVLEKIWADWEKFASYAFNKSHATCYSWVAYQTAYLKAHYPAEYMAGVLSRNLGATDKLSKIMDESRRMGIVVKGPDVNESVRKFGVTPSGEIRFGLSAVKGVGDSAVTAIVTEREKNGPYKDIYDFMERVNLSACNRGAVESLALAGAFDSFGIPREAIVAPVLDNTTFAETLVRYGQRFQNDSNSLQMSLFADFEPIETDRPPLPDYTPWNRFKLLEAEKNLVTMYLSAHPLDPYYMELKYHCTCPCAEFEEAQDDGVELMIGGMVVDAVTRVTRSGNEWGIVTIEDFSGKAEVKLFGKSFKEWFHRFTVGDAVAVKMRFMRNMYKPEFMDMSLDRMIPLEDLRGNVANSICIYLESTFSDKAFFDTLKSFELRGSETPSADESEMPPRPGDLTLRIAHEAREQELVIHSRKKYNIGKSMVDFLEQWDTPFRITDN
ncbi:MAG: DNA polymerase III subunit alpha [Bacteroides sp.]|nr:DNA polymerase III subunit alpha [Bacteroides sp.]